MTKLSIIIPTFNSGPTLDRCLASIASQTFTDYEILIQDGGSSDYTIDLVRSFERSNPGVNVKLQQEKDDGIYDAMNKATRRASGEWLYYLGSDDELYDPLVLEKIFGSKAARTQNVIYGSVLPLGSGGQVVPPHSYQGRFSLRRLLAGPINHQAIFYRASFARAIGAYNTKYAVWADWDFNLRCRSKTRFRFMNLIVANYFVGGFSGGKRDQVFDADMAANVSRYFNPLNPMARIGYSYVHSAKGADLAYSLRENGDERCLSVMTTSILQWPFGDITRYKVWLHMLLTRLNIIAKPVRV